MGTPFKPSDVVRFFVLALFATGAAAQLVCVNTSGARTLFRETCVRDLACRYEIVNNARIQTGATWDVDLAPRIDDILFSNETRRLFEIPPAWSDTPLVAVNESDPAARDCEAIALSLETNSSQGPPMEIRYAVATLVKYQNYVAEDSRCNDLNTIAVYTPDGTLSCQCLPGKICQASGQARRDTMTTAVIVIIIAVAVGTLITTVASTAAQWRRRPTRRDSADLALLEMDGAPKK